MTDITTCIEAVIREHLYYCGPLHVPTLARQIAEELSKGAGEVVPDGWVLVPEYPNQEMICALEECEEYCDSCKGTSFSGQSGYAAMLKVAPKPPATPKPPAPETAPKSVGEYGEAIRILRTWPNYEGWDRAGYRAKSCYDAANTMEAIVAERDRALEQVDLLQSKRHREAVNETEVQRVMSINNRCVSEVDRLTTENQALQQRVAELEGELKAEAHIANEFADGMCNGIQWLRNVRDDISNPVEALNEMEENLKRIRVLTALHPTPEAKKEGA